MTVSAQQTAPAAGYPLSYAQQRLWFLDRLQPGRPTYNGYRAYRLRGAVHTELLACAINEIVRRHEVLRARIDSHLGLARQSILETLSVPLPIVNLQEGGVYGIDDVLRGEARRPFDLDTGPMIRTTLYRVAQDEHVLLIVIHHIVTDGWSMEILERELGEVYSALVSGRGSPLPPLPMQYTDFAEFERARLEQGELERQLEFWREQLSGIRPLELPTDHPRPPSSDHEGGRARRHLSAELTAKFKGVAVDHGVTLFIMLLATFQVLLFRHGGHGDIAVGVPVSNRMRTAWQSLIGLFVNTLVMRTKLRVDETFTELLRRVRSMAFDAYANTDLPFEKLVEELAPQRDMSRNPLFQAMLTLRNTVDNKLELAGLDVEELAVDIGVAKFDLSLEVCERESALDLSLVYRRDLFARDSMENLLRRFEILAESVVADPGLPVGALEILSDCERRRLLVDWNPVPGRPSGPHCVHELFEQWVRQTPDAAALRTPGGYLDYRELDDRAEALADRMRARGVAPGVAVGLCLERSPQLVIGVLAILKAGGTYVPLDPRFPQERLKRIVEAAAIRMVLVSEPSAPVGDLPCEVLDMGAQVRVRPGAGRASRRECASPHHDAYVIFTSGSSGLPKGVPISHAAISANCAVMRGCYEIVPEDRVLLFSRFTFDQSLNQLLLPLSCGACVVPAPAELPDPPAFSELLHHHRVSVVNLAPAYWRQWVQAMSTGRARSDLPRLRLVSVGGDVVPIDTVRLWKELTLSDSVRLLNAYGPTEATITTLTYRIDSVPSGRSVPIGRPLPGRLVYILDAKGKLVPSGVPGELCIGGDFLSRGYLNAPELTAEKFTSNPFIDDPGARLYRSGDQARYLPDGNIEFLGRLDFQVKIRGFRIELAEVEHALRDHPSVQDAVVVALGEAPEDKTLAAYVVTLAAEQDTGPELQAYLKKVLPEYMVPTTFVSLDELPLNPYGKVDRQALPAPDRSSRATTAAFSVPADGVESELASIWCSVLDLEKVGRRDNFLDLGGNSINAMQISARMNAHFGVDLPLSIMFDTVSLAELAEAVRAGRSSTAARVYS